MKTTETRCLLGNGACPETCVLYGQALRATNDLGKNFKPPVSRIAVLFGDAFSHEISVIDVAAAVGSCQLESARTYAE